jgi:tRNA A-37 threonylcarbamoyl transferase component Bud32
MADWDPLVNEIFARAIEAGSPAERAAVLDRSCRGDARLRHKVEALLLAHDQAGSFLDHPAPGLVATSAEGIGAAPTLAKEEEAGSATATTDGTEPAARPAGLTQMVGSGPSHAAGITDYRPMSEAGIVIAGRYTLQEKIGEGGMGEVWVAKQTQPVKRRVALKLIKTGMDSNAVLQRFEQERQALAMMDHPNIAHVLDGGLTPTGQPFLVMALVNGLSLTKFCDEARLTSNQRLELFVPICQAVQHAHQKGIVHRDLKPANILITLIDGKPIPKVIDFGVAKATAGKLTDESMSTQFGSVIGTLEYMSPEQTGFSGVDIDTRADIYSLGVILYELLTGLKPIDARRLEKAAITEMIRIIREEEPSKPSTRLSTNDSLPSLAALRQTEPRKLMALLRGELDWVVMKCLEKSRERRYETASGLARDIQRYLADEAVEARPPSAAYRFGKFLKRHKAPAVAAGLVLLTLLAGIAGTTYGLIRAEAQRRKAVAAQTAEADQRALAVAQRDNAVAAEQQTGIERDKAIAAESKSRAINEFLTQDLLTQAEPANNAPEDHVTLLEVLDRAAEKVGQRFADHPELESALRMTIAATYHGLASWEKAEAQWRVKLQVERKRDTESAATYIAQSELAHVLRHRGRRDTEVMEMAESAALGLERTLGPGHADTLEMLNHLAAAYLDTGKIPEAIALFERIRDAEIVKLGPDHRGTLTTLINLAGAYRVADKIPEAIALFERVRDKQIAKLGPDHPDTLTTLHNLALAYWAAGKLPDAIALFERVRDARIAKLGPDNPHTLDTLGDLAGAYRDAGKLPEAVALFERVRDAEIAKLGPDHPSTLNTLNNLALAYRKAGKLPEAIAVLERVRDDKVAKLGPDHPDTLTTLNNLALAYSDTGRQPQAIALLEQVRDGKIAKLGPDHSETLATLNDLAVVYKAAGKVPEAITLLERIRDGKIAKLGLDHPDTLKTLNNLAWAYADAGKLAEAIALGERVRDAEMAKLGLDHPHTLTAFHNLAAWYWRANRLDKSVLLFEDVLKRQEPKLGRQHPHTQMTVANLGVNYKDSGRLDEAIPLLEEAYRASSTFSNLRWVNAVLFDAYVKAGRAAEAAKLVQELLANARKTAAKDSPQLAGILAQFSLTLLQAKAYADAEPILRECLAIREKIQPDLWNTFAAKSMLGGALLGQKKYADAEPLLIAGYEGMKQRETTIPPQGKDRLTEALERLVQLYEAVDKSVEAARWRQDLEARKAAAKPPEKKL